MNALKISFIDMLKIRNQLFIMVIFTALAYIFMSKGSGLMAVLYMIFCAVIFSTQPFMLDQASESGFLNLLPFSLQERIRGRYTFGLLLMLLADVLVTLAAQLYRLKSNDLPENWYILLMICTGVGLAILSLQYLAFYAIGKFKSQQVASMIMMLPGFILFFGGSYAVQYIGNSMPQIVTWLIRNYMLVGGISLAAGIIIWGLGIVCSYALTCRRDMN